MGKEKIVIELGSTSDYNMDYCKNTLHHGGPKEMSEAAVTLGLMATKGDVEAKKMVRELATKGNSRIKSVVAGFVSMI